MGAIRLVFVVLLLGFICKANAQPAYHISVSPGNSKTKTGHIITLTVTVSGPGIKKVLWGATDSWFAGNSLINNIGAKSTVTGAGKSQRKFMFTAIKAGSVAIGPIPVVLQYAGSPDTVFTASSNIAFYNNKLPVELADIKDITRLPLPYQQYFPVIAISVAGLVILFFLLKLIIRLIKRKALPGPVAMRNAFLKKIYFLETQITPDTQTVKEINEQALSIFREYLACSCIAPVLHDRLAHNNAGLQLSHTDQATVDNIIKTAGHIRFSMHHNAVLLEESLNQIKNFISNYTQPTS